MGVADEPAGNPIYDAAEQYVRLGISVIPIQPGTKEPPIDFHWGEYVTRIADASERYDWFVDKGYQIAIVSGPASGWLVPLDFDGTEPDGGFAAMAARFPDLRRLPRVRTGSGKTHVWVRVDRPTEKYVTCTPDGSKLEVRANVHYTVAPPSVHPDTGKEYTWELAPWDGVPTVALESLGLVTIDLGSREIGDPIDEGDPLSERDRQHVRELVQPFYVEGQRHDLCLSLAGWLANHGVPESDARWLVESLALASGDTKEVRDFLRTVRDTYAKTRKGISVSGWARLTDRRYPLVSEAASKRLDLLLRYYNPPVNLSPKPIVAAGERFRLIPIQEMKSRVPPPPLVSGLLSCGSLAGLVGDSGTFKSFLAVDLSIHLGLGLPWFGHAVEAGLVVYVSAEGQAGMGARIKAWEIAHDADAANVWFITEAPSIPDRVDVEGLLARFKDLDEAPRLIVLDTLARTMVGMDENSTPDMGLYVAGADRLRFATGAAVLVIHHENKAGGYRGSTAFKAALDTMFVVKQDDDNKRVVTLSTDKQKDLELMAPLALRAEVVEITPGDGIFPGLNSVVMEATDGPSRQRGTRDEEIVAAVSALGWCELSEIAEAVSLSERRLRPRVNGLVARNVLRLREVPTGRSPRHLFGSLEARDDDPSF